MTSKPTAPTEVSVTPEGDVLKIWVHKPTRMATPLCFPVLTLPEGECEEYVRANPAKDQALREVLEALKIDNKVPYEYRIWDYTEDGSDPVEKAIAKIVAVLGGVE